jgi:predicted RNA-binding protein with EMAP domain
VSATTDPGSVGEYQHCVYDYVGAADLEWEDIVALVEKAKSIVDPLGQELHVRIASDPPTARPAQ